MKTKGGFWRSLERYTWRVVVRSPLPHAWIGVGLVVVAILASSLNVKNSVVGARDLRGVIEKAAERGDYTTASQLWSNQDRTAGNESILGAESELEDKVYPERVVERQIAELEGKLGEYPEHRDILLEISRLYRELGEQEKAEDYFEQARVLDPNGEWFR